MSRSAVRQIATYGLLGTAVTVTLMLPEKLSVPDGTAATPPDTITVSGLVRDFRSDHPDFDVVPDGGTGHYAGNVATLLSADGRPLQVQGVTQFVVSFGHLVPGVPYAARATVLGAEITSAGNPVPVTIQAETDTETFEPYGIYSDPEAGGDVNDGNNPRDFVFSLTDVYSAETPISITATSWLENPGGGSEFGYHSTHDDQRKDAEHAQVATRFNMASSGTVTSITALIETDQDTAYPVVYAIYDDNAGEPGNLIVETAQGSSPDSDTWYTLAVTPTWLATGDYWLALSMSHNNQNYQHATTGGDTRRRSNDAVSNGFLSSWGASSSNSDIKLCIYATYTADLSYTPHMTVRSGDESPYVKVLMDGDPVPSIPAFQDQANLATFVADYIDVDSGLVTLQSNQAIYLFELGTTNLLSASADFQDLVIMVTLATDPVYFYAPGETGEGTNAIGYKIDGQWTDSAGRNIAPHTYKPSLGDSAGVSGDTDSGGVSSPASFYQWYRDVLGVNQSVVHDITLTNDGSGVYEFDTDAFYPADAALLGNEGEPHNSHFTYAMNATFSYDDSASQFFEMQGGDGAWLYIDGKLAIDLGGVQTGVSQFADLSRFGLVDGETYEVSLFYANRDPASSSFHFRTNAVLNGGELLGSVTAAFD